MNLEEKLIELVKENPILYDKQHKDFKNFIKRDKLWKHISKELGVDEKKTKSRWKTLRDTYRAEWAKRNKMPSGSNSSKTWKFFHQLSFLNDGTQPQKTLSNYEDMSETILYLSTRDPAEEEVMQILPDISSDDGSSSSLFLERARMQQNVEHGTDTSVTDSTSTTPFLKPAIVRPPKYSHCMGNSTSHNVDTPNCKNLLKSITYAINEPEKNGAEDEVDAFFRTMAAKVNQEQLPRDDLDNFQECVLSYINKQLASYRNK